MVLVCFFGFQKKNNSSSSSWTPLARTQESQFQAIDDSPSKFSRCLGLQTVCNCPRHLDMQSLGTWFGKMLGPGQVILWMTYCGIFSERLFFLNRETKTGHHMEHGFKHIWSVRGIESSTIFRISSANPTKNLVSACPSSSWFSSQRLPTSRFWCCSP